MLKLFLNTTDNFLCANVKNIFEKVENGFADEHKEFNVTKELQNLEDDPLGCTLGNHSNFETTVKIKIKMLIGFFFVAVPLMGFAFLAYISSVAYTYAFVLTFVVAILVASRMEEIARRYVAKRALQQASC